MNALQSPLVCPMPAAAERDRITLAHGEGGRLTRRLIEEHILPILGNEFLAPLGDSAVLGCSPGSMAFTTDSFVVSPLFFPGGDIGTLAVFGTVNDLAVSGARPRWLSVALIIEEGLPFAVLLQVVHSIAAAARRAQVEVVAGDTKVVPRGAADGLFITTSGIGELIPPVPPGPASLETGDELIVSGPIGRHGISILAARENLGFDPPPMSDCGPLTCAVEVLRQAQIPIRSMRDATRGGVAAVLHEWAQASGHTLTVSESSLPPSSEVRGACELLGLDPLHMACEGTLVLCTPAGFSVAAVEAFRTLPETRAATRIGEVRPRGIAAATVLRILGTEQPLDDPMGAPLPRIC